LGEKPPVPTKTTTGTYTYIDKFGKEEMEGSLKCLNIIHLDRKLPRETNGWLPLLDILSTNKPDSKRRHTIHGKLTHMDSCLQ